MVWKKPHHPFFLKPFIVGFLFLKNWKPYKRLQWRGFRVERLEEREAAVVGTKGREKDQGADFFSSWSHSPKKKEKNEKKKKREREPTEKEELLASNIAGTATISTAVNITVKVLKPLCFLLFSYLVKQGEKKTCCSMSFYEFFWFFFSFSV